ncbi:MAG: hypothetical protein DMD35_01955 [Gemmatimonadetes bacterium]|nr:MAG: hypothetical protein DMD35_01955 [Gemmatimonadota bacterium]HMC56237.1 hypothetical protein [Gemmatimonadaceae bacterium]
MSRARSKFQHTPLWAAVASTLTELQASGEVRIDTETDYVIDYLCRELAAKQVVTPEAVSLAPGR